MDYCCCNYKTLPVYFFWLSRKMP